MPLRSTLRISLFWVLCFGIALASWRFVPMGVEAGMGFVAYHANLRPWPSLPMWGWPPWR